MSNGFDSIAASLGDLADWAENELAGGKPPTWVAQQEYERVRQIAYIAELTGRGRLTPAALDGILRGHEGDDGDTLTLGMRGAVAGPPGHRGRRRLSGLARRITGAGSLLKSWLTEP